MNQSTKNPKYIPFTKSQVKKKGHGFTYGGSEYIHHSQLHVSESALSSFSARQIAFLGTLAALLAAGLLINWMTTIIVILFLLAILYMADLLFNMNLIARSLWLSPAIDIDQKALKALRKVDHPVYTILCPLYKESEVLPQFVKAIKKLDYNKQKLQVLLLLEESDHETIKMAKSMRLPRYFEIVVVPHSMPKTKPKACNYGLQMAKGEYVVIFDAEDIPDPDQLKKAVLAFKGSSKKVVCIQSELAFYNPHQNILTRAFTAEYSLWFNLILTGLQSIEAPIPLGGTSNHFRTNILKELGGWDAFNVTEDADLGMRIVKKGYTTSVLKSTTLEEANSNLINWFWQRSRWVKGYMQTYLVHNRKFRSFPKSGVKKPHHLTFQLVIGGKVLSMLVNPIMWLLTITYVIFHATLGPSISQFFPPAVLYLSVTSLIVGNFLYMYYYMIGSVQKGNYGLVKYTFIVPFYWLAMSCAAYYALFELIYKPHRWRKTKHGLHLTTKAKVGHIL